MIIKPKKKYKILIRLVVVRRDYSTFGLLKCCLEHLGCKVLIVSSHNYTLALRFWKPDAVIAHTLSSGKTAKEILPSVKIFFLDAEGFRGEDHCHAIYFLKQSELINDFSFFFFWGTQIIKEFVKFAPELDISKIEIIGNPKLDLARFLKDEDKSKNTIKKNSIGIATRFHALNNHIGRPVIFSLANNPGKYKYTDTQMRSFIALMDIIKAILRDTDFNISIRVHPFEAIEGYKDNLKRWFGEKNFERFYIDESLDFSEWVIKQNVVITPTSTAITECYLLNTPVINIDKIAKVVLYNKKIDKVVEDWFDGAYLPSTISELIKMLKDRKLSTKKSKIIEDMLKNYCDWHNEDFAARVSLNHILKKLNDTKKSSYKISLPLFLIKFLLSIRDRIQIFKNPLFKNFNYSSYHHRTPSIYNKVVKQIFNKNNYLDSED